MALLRALGVRAHDRRARFPLRPRRRGQRRMVRERGAPIRLRSRRSSRRCRSRASASAAAWCARRSPAATCKRAAQLLGRAYSMRGRVRRGEQLGRTLGFPTANLPVDAAAHAARRDLRGARARRARLAPARCGWRARLAGGGEPGHAAQWSTAPCRCSRCICSISTATCTARSSKWSSWRGCAMS